MTVVRHTTNQVLEVWSVRTLIRQINRWYLATVRNFSRLGPVALRHRLSTVLPWAS